MSAVSRGELLVFILEILLEGVQATDNYPKRFDNPKPCILVKRPVLFDKPLCQPDCKGGFTEESEKNCWNEFKEGCPEFNEASCEWHDLDFPEGRRQIPTCRLKYYAADLRATKFTWMEILYTHQYGQWMLDKSWKNEGANCSAMKTLDVVEVNRRIKNHDAFGDRDGDGDWPKSVVDSKGQRGLSWKAVNNTKPFPQDLVKNDVELCYYNLKDNKFLENDYQDYLCSKKVTSFLTDNGYRIGFDNASNPKPSQIESDWKRTPNSTVSAPNYTQRTQCIDVVLADGKVRRGCQVIYSRKILYKNEWVNDVCEYDYLEVQVYSVSSQRRGELEIRYAYFPLEEPNTMDDLFCTPV